MGVHQFPYDIGESPAVADLREEIVALRSFARHSEVPGSVRGPLIVYIAASLKQFETLNKRGWFNSAFEQLRASESPMLAILRLCLTLLLSFFIITVTVLPDVIAFTINKRAFNARTLPAQSRTGVQILSMLSFPQASLRLAWTFAVERLALPIANTVAYAFVAWNPAYRYLPKKLWFQITVGVANVLGQLGQTFIMNVWLTWERFWRRRILPLPFELQYRAGTNYASLKRNINALHALAKDADLGRHMTTEVALPKATYRTYYYDYYLVLTVAAAGVSGLLRQGERALSPYHSTRDMINGFSILTAGQIPAILVLAIPLLVALTDLFADFMLICARKVNWIPAEEETSKSRKEHEDGVNAAISAALEPLRLAAVKAKGKEAIL
ncbi:hypothetical protein FHL15_003608 [Xylaria flabelliformis]|uniref:Uncharacterized protein n=1 Tax=Xylaria flabelliformis TaxID=2512241 RepID=A0A553I625_9PEZI|nr:hypothetical protein FHL15_003608 [Xylaria flabelliformis]